MRNPAADIDNWQCYKWGFLLMGRARQLQQQYAEPYSDHKCIFNTCGRLYQHRHTQWLQQQGHYYSSDIAQTRQTNSGSNE